MTLIGDFVLDETQDTSTHIPENDEKLNSNENKIISNDESSQENKEFVEVKSTPNGHPNDCEKMCADYVVDNGTKIKENTLTTKDIVKKYLNNTPYDVEKLAYELAGCVDEFVNNKINEDIKNKTLNVNPSSITSGSNELIVKLSTSKFLEYCEQEYPCCNISYKTIGEALKWIYQTKDLNESLANDLKNHNGFDSCYILNVPNKDDDNISDGLNICFEFK